MSMGLPAVVGYYEPWWIQVIKTIVIFEWTTSGIAATT